MNAHLQHKTGVVIDPEKLKSFLIGIYVFFLPLSDWSPVKVNSILIILASSVWLFEMISSVQARSTWKWKTTLVLSAIFLTQLLSIVHGGSQQDWLSNIMVKLPFLIFPLVWNRFGSGLSFSRIKKYFIAGTLLACLLSLRFLWLNSFDVNQLLNYHPYEAYLLLHRPYFGIYLLLSICFLMDHLRSSYAAIIMTGLLTAFLIWIQAKTAIALLVILFFIHIAFHAGQIVRRTFLILAGFVAVILLTGSLYYYLKHRDELDTSNGFKRFFILSFNTRIIHTECATKIIREHPLMGAGAGHAMSFMNQCYDEYKPYKPNFSQSGKIYNAHNEWLEEAIRHGLIGVLVYAGCFWIFFRKAFQKKDKIYLQFLLIVVVASMTESLFSREQGVLMIAFMNCFFYFRHHFTSAADNALTMSEASA
jgi:O-antigen ligase